MRCPALFAIPLLFLACERQLGVDESAVHVDVSFDFNAGCIVVLARDKAAPDKEDRKQAEVFGRGSRTADFAVFRGEDWGRTIEITVSARERTCEGPVVASETREFTLDKAGSQPMAVLLHAPDEDDDGYVPASHNGTDCDDTHAGSNPGVTTELCDGRDNNCINGVDDGWVLADFFLDGDGDGVGAGTAKRACAAPPDHVAFGGDCDDNDGERFPSRAEVCDGLDNDCDPDVDEGLATNPYHRDVDGDGFGAQADMVQRCGPPAGYVAATPVFDCNDEAVAVNPGATEVCNEVDDNCVGGSDEGFDKSWYRDADDDGFGREDDMQLSCTKPDGYVAATPVFDCNDGSTAVRPGATELCNEVDDNCVDGIDEAFTQKGANCTNDVCSGEYICNLNQDGTVCNAPAPVSYYTDGDGDGEGATSGPVEKVCPPAPAPGGKVANNTDCDDNDPHNRGGGSEVCDDRDNNCLNGKDDETAVCGGKGWEQLTDTLSTSRNWNTVAVGAGGEPVWIAGDSGALAVRLAGSTTFTDRNQQCGNTRWNASWVRPSDGQVFLAGDGGTVAAYNAISACTTSSTLAATTNASNKNLLGIVGFESGGVTKVYVVNDDGAVFEWTPGSTPVFKVKRSSNDPYQDIHGRVVSKLLIAAVDSSTEVHGYNAETNARGGHTITGVPSANNGSTSGIWAWDDTHAYAVGKKGVFLSWNGTTTWTFSSPDASMTVDLNSVVALDAYAAYVASQDGKIRRPRVGAWVEHFTASGALKDIAAASRQDIWAVGHGIVVHFPE